MRQLRSGVTPRTAPRIPHAFITLYNKYTYEIILFWCYACGPIPRAWAILRDTRNALSALSIAPVRTRGGSLVLINRHSVKQYDYFWKLLKIKIRRGYIDGRCGVAVGILAYYARRRGLDSRTVQTFVRVCLYWVRVCLYWVWVFICIIYMYKKCI
jgi:hypothetical protein